ncbi:hypothetical protein MPSEU_000927500 [Mayamaea pseudoterrestris]|nr:hypothetical protein MPSEU_000927500 [Mayamaea pseudoterrestris]
MASSSSAKHALLLATCSIATAASTSFGVSRSVARDKILPAAPCHLYNAIHSRGGSLSDDKSPPSEEAKLKQKSKKKKTRSKTSVKQEPSHSDEASASSPPSPLSSAKASDDKSKTPQSPELPSIIQEILKQDDYYEILGLSRDSSHSDRAVQKAYRRRTLLTHPDKTSGNRRAFDKVAEAYSVLSDATQRAIYDKFGKAGLTQQHGGVNGQGSSPFASADDFFQSFFGGGGPSFFGASQQQARTNRTVRYQLEISLEDLYQGVSHSIQIGAGGQSPLRKTVHVDIPRGAQDGQSVRLSGEIDFDATEAPGDLIFLLKQRPHAVFTRKGYDLAIVVTISLQEAVSGVTQNIVHLSGETLVIQSARSKQQQQDGIADPVLIHNGDVQVLKGKGMPKDKLGTSYGDLYIQYQVELPRMKHPLTIEERAELTRLLNKLEGKQDVKPSLDKDDGAKVQYAQPANASDFGRASGTPSPLAQEQDDPLHHDDDGSTGGRPFSRRGFSFSSSSTGREFPFGFPFEQEGDDVQCRQM